MADIKSRNFMTKREEKLKEELIKLLQKNRHAKYAERLKYFIINIVPVSGPEGDPNFVAAISFETGIIYISEGFLQDPAVFAQLDVVIRHELAHNLMMHQIRMANKLKGLGIEALQTSSSIHHMINFIEDDEISNKRYTAADKEVVRKMWLNGRLIGGLVTEDHREAWLHLSVEEMYDKLTAELEAVHRQYLAKREIYIDVDLGGMPSDSVKSAIVDTYIYNETDEESQIPTDTVDDFIKSGFMLLGGKGGKYELPEEYRQIVIDINDALKATPLEGEEIEKLLDEIAYSSPIKYLDLIHPITKEVICNLKTPEDKLIAADTIKKFRSQYLYWYTRVLRTIRNKLSSGEFDRDTVDRLLDEVR